MRTFIVECPKCGLPLDLSFSEEDLVGEDPLAAVCVDCKTDFDVEYDAETQDLIPVVDDEDEDDEEEDEPAPTDAAEEEEDEV